MKTEKIKSEKGTPRTRFSLGFKKKVVAEYERGFLNKDQLQAKYNMEATSTLKAIKMAVKNRAYQNLPLIHHSDRGLQYCSKLYTNYLTKIISA